MNEFIDSLFPVSTGGFIFDAFVSNADVNGYKREALARCFAETPTHGVERVAS